MKTNEELNELKNRYEKLAEEINELTPEELEEVTGGAGYIKPQRIAPGRERRRSKEEVVTTPRRPYLRSSVFGDDEQ